MAEGDTIHRARLRLDPILAAQPLEEFWAKKLRGHRPRPGYLIESVRAHGKHLLIDFDHDLTLDTHLGMVGSWRSFPKGGEPQRVRRNPKLRLILSTSKGSALCFAAPSIQTFLRTDSISPLSKLGPDLAIATPQIEQALQRARDFQRPAAEIHGVLLDQKVAAGIGNIFKSESLHEVGLYPFTKLGHVSDETLQQLFQAAASQLHKNIRDGHMQRKISTVGSFYVYGRWRKPCRRCDTPIERSYRGAQGRSTYWCPRCQPAPPR